MTTTEPAHPAIAGAAPWQRAACDYIDRLRQQYGERLAAVVLYGSRARGDAHESESDVDLLVVLRGEFDDPKEQQLVWELAWQLEDKYGYPLLAAIVATEHDYRRRMLPLFMNIRREGIELWPAKLTTVRDEEASYGAITDDVALIRYRMSEALDDAKAGLAQSRHNWATNRAYYAMFHAATALLLQEELAFSRHRGVISAFNERYVKTGRLPRQLGSQLDAAFAARNRADYAYNEPISKELAAELVRAAQEFVAAAERLLDSPPQ